MRVFLKSADGSIADKDGRIIFCSLDRFINQICDGEHCFVCGASPEDTKFDDEHIIPRWILKRFDMYNQSITLVDGRLVRYANYTIPCCVRCNRLLGKALEDEISNAVKGGIDSVNQLIANGGAWKIFLWLSLIFLKTYVKDSYLRKHLDRRKSDESIASEYDWEWMHHIHCMVRAVMAGHYIEPECFGSTFVFSAKDTNLQSGFDYRDMYIANTILLKLGDIAFIAVLDDSCYAANFFSDQTERISGPLSSLQLLEVLSHLTLINMKMKERPVYHTKVDPTNGEVSIGAKMPKNVELADFESSEFGEILFASIYPYIGKIGTEDGLVTEDMIRSGHYRFLFDEQGKFVEDSMDTLLKDDE